MSTENFVSSIHNEIHTDFKEQKRILSFDEYLLLIQKSPRQHLRSSAQYITDMMDHYGRDEKTGRFRVFDQEFSDERFRLIGLEKVQENIYRILQSFIREGINNKMILLHGPNGSAKSSLINCLIRGMEDYSHTEDGALYRFYWIFPVDKFGKPALGFSAAASSDSYSDSFAKLDDSEIAARIPCDLKDHPLFLVPEEEREKYIEELDISKDFKISEYIRKGDLSHKSRLIYEALLRSYKGDFKRVMQHVQVERFYVSKRYREAAITIEPQLQVDAHAQQVTMDRSLQMLPSSLHSLNLVNLGGDLIDGNRGLIEYNDLLKRPIDAFKYILVTTEAGTVSVSGNTAFIDAVMFGTCNELQLDAFKEYPDFMSFKARIELVRVPYILEVSKEAEIYQTQVTRIAGDHHVAPHTLDLAAMWAVLCRLKKPNATHYASSLAYLINALTPVEKARLYDGGQMPPRLSAEDRKLLRSNFENIAREYRDIPYYEGRTGPSPREIKLILFDALERNDRNILSPLGLFDALKEFVKRTTEYEYLRENVVEGYHDCAGFVETLKDIYLERVDEEVRSSIGMYDESQFGKFLEKYISQISASLKNEKVKNPITGKSEDPDKSLMDEFEKVVKAPDDRKAFRQNLITQIGVYALENSDSESREPDYSKIFPDLMKKMRDFYQNENTNLMKKIYDAMVLYLEPEAGMEPGKVLKEPQNHEQTKHRDLAANLLKNMIDRFAYNDASAREAFAFLVQKRH